MLDSGSMTCTLSEQVEQQMLVNKLLPAETAMKEEVVLVGCGGVKTTTKRMYEVEMELYGVKCIVPILVVPGQRDELIIGSNVIRYLTHQLKSTMTTGAWCPMAVYPSSVSSSSTY